MSEDCLTLNIFRPAGTSAQTKLPVMVWIFGGGFIEGQSSIYNATEIIVQSVVRVRVLSYIFFYYLHLLTRSCAIDRAHPSCTSVSTIALGPSDSRKETKLRNAACSISGSRTSFLPYNGYKAILAPSAGTLPKPVRYPASIFPLFDKIFAGHCLRGEFRRYLHR